MNDLNYKGYRLNIDVEYDYESSKKYLYHDVYKDGKRVASIDWSSYGTPITQADFELWIDLGQPTRYHRAILSDNGVWTPLNTEKLLKIKAYKGL